MLRKKNIFFCFFCLLLFLPVSFCSAEQSYLIEEAEIKELESIFWELENINTQLQSELKRSKEDLSESVMRLQGLNQRLEVLKSELGIARNDLMQAQNLLVEANTLLDVFEEETRRTEKRLKRQRNFVWSIVGLVGAIVVAK